MDNSGNKVRWSRLPNCSFFIHCSGNQFKVQCVHQRQTDWNKGRRSWLGPMWCCATARLGLTGYEETSVFSPSPPSACAIPGRSQRSRGVLGVISGARKFNRASSPDANVSICPCSLKYLLPVPKGPFQAPALPSGVGSEPMAGEVSVPLVPRLADSEVGMTGPWHSSATVSVTFAWELSIPAAQTGIVGSWNDLQSACLDWKLRIVLHWANIQGVTNANEPQNHPHCRD